MKREQEVNREARGLILPGRGDEETQRVCSTQSKTPDSCARASGWMHERCLKRMMFLMLPLQTEDDSDPAFHFFD